MAQTVGNTVAQVETPLVRRSSLVALISVAGLGIVSSPANGSVSPSLTFTQAMPANFG